MPAILIGPIYFYHFRSLSVTLNSEGGHKVSGMQTYWRHFLTHFSFNQDEFGMMLKQIKWNILILFFSESQGKEPPRNDICMHSDVYELIWFKLGMMKHTSELYIFMLV